MKLEDQQIRYALNTLQELNSMQGREIINLKRRILQIEKVVRNLEFGVFGNSKLGVQNE